MIMLKKLIELLLPINMTRPISSIYEQIPQLLHYGVQHFKKNWTQLENHDGQGGTVYPFDSLASFFNDPTNIYTNTCIIPDRANENGCSIPEAGIEMVAR